MPRPTKEQWADARSMWEADPKQNFETIAKTMKVSRVAVSKRAANEGWKRTQSLRAIVEQAQLKADAKVSPKHSEVSAGPVKTAEEVAVEVRADVLERHRLDWNEHRELFTLQAISADFDAGKKAKISAEMTMIRQKGERAAYGLDTDDGSKAASAFESLLDLAGE